MNKKTLIATALLGLFVIVGIGASGDSCCCAGAGIWLLLALIGGGGCCCCCKR